MDRPEELKADMELGDLAPSTTSSPGYRLEFVDISYQVTTSAKEKKTLIQPVSGLIRPKEMVCIMGQSGAGKSTMLDILAGRIHFSDQLTGSLLVNGSPVGSSYKRVSGYVMQDDALYPLLTVRETFLFAACLRVSGKSYQEKQQLVEQTMSSLKLTSAANTIIGDDQKRGLSGGERRRVSIGVDTIHQPYIIFLDEPTSGLDSATALSIVETLHELCTQGNRTIILTIHQPSMKIFNTFDTAMFMAKGNMIYHGKVAQLAEWVMQTGLAKEIPQFTNLPEFFLEVIEGFVERGDLKTLLDHTTNKNLDTGLHRNSHVHSEQIEAADYANSFISETWILMKRNFINVVRTKELFFARLGLSAMMGLVMGSTFLFAKHDTQEGITLIGSYLIYLLALYLFTSMEALPIFLNERNIYTREASRGAYRTSSYVLSGALTYIPFTFVLACVFSVISWFLVGLPNKGDNFMFHVFVILLTCFNGNCFATLISGIAPDALTGNGMGTAMLANFFLFSGFFIPRKKIPGWFIWIFWISPFRYGYESLTLNIYHMLNTPASNFEIRRLNEQHSNKWYGVIALFGFGVLYRVLFGLILKKKHSGMRS